VGRGSTTAQAPDTARGLLLKITRPTRGWFAPQKSSSNKREFVNPRFEFGMWPLTPTTDLNDHCKKGTFGDGRRLTLH